MGANGDTTLAVFEGKIELSNAQGSVTVTQGEGAFAAIGKAPTKYTLVDLKEREQILLYGELRGAFSELPATGGPAPAARRERQRILAIPEGQRSAADWLTLAEVALVIDGRDVAREALGHRPISRCRGRSRRGRHWSRRFVPEQERNYREAAALFGKAQAGLPQDRRASRRLW